VTIIDASRDHMRVEVAGDPPNDSDVEFVRIRAHDLREAARRADDAREQTPHQDVLLEIGVLLAADARTACNALADARPAVTDGFTYAGTPEGLTSLLNDIRILDIADGVVLLPIGATPIADTIRREVLPRLNR